MLESIRRTTLIREILKKIFFLMRYNRLQFKTANLKVPYLNLIRKTLKTPKIKQIITKNLKF